MATPIHTTAAPTQITIRPPGQFFEGEGPGVADLIDTINPLQHIPFVSTLYRNLTGDTTGAGSKLLGGVLFGGPFGFIAGLADVIFESATGKPMGESVLAALTGETENPNQQFASNEINLGDFSGDARRNICKNNCSLEAPLVAQAETESPTELAVLTSAPIEPPVATAQTINIPDPKARSASVALDATQRKQDQAILSLFGGNNGVATHAYQSASLREALQKSSTNLVL